MNQTSQYEAKHRLTRGLQHILLFGVILCICSCSPPRYWVQGDVISTIQSQSDLTWSSRKVSWQLNAQTGKTKYTAHHQLNPSAHTTSVFFDLNAPNNSPQLSVEVDGKMLVVNIEKIKTPTWWQQELNYNTRGWSSHLPLTGPKHHRHTFEVPPGTKTLKISGDLTLPKIPANKSYLGVVMVEQQGPKTQHNKTSLTNWKIDAPESWLVKDPNTIAPEQRQGLLVKMTHLPQPNVEGFEHTGTALAFILFFLFLIGVIGVNIRAKTTSRAGIITIGLTIVYGGLVFGGTSLYTYISHTHLLDSMWHYCTKEVFRVHFLSLFAIAIVWTIIVPLILITKAIVRKHQSTTN